MIKGREKLTAEEIRKVTEKLKECEVSCSFCGERPIVDILIFSFPLTAYACEKCSRLIPSRGIKRFVKVPERTITNIWFNYVSYAEQIVIHKINNRELLSEKTDAFESFKKEILRVIQRSTTLVTAGWKNRRGRPRKKRRKK